MRIVLLLAGNRIRLFLIFRGLLCLFLLRLDGLNKDRSFHSVTDLLWFNHYFVFKVSLGSACQHHLTAFLLVLQFYWSMAVGSGCFGDRSLRNPLIIMQ